MSQISPDDFLNDDLIMLIYNFNNNINLYNERKKKGSIINEPYTLISIYQFLKDGHTRLTAYCTTFRSNNIRIPKCLSDSIKAYNKIKDQLEIDWSLLNEILDDYLNTHGDDSR